VQYICVLGSTGSIGTNCLEVIRAAPERFHLDAVVARRNWEELGRQTQEFDPRWAVLSDANQRGVVQADAFSPRTELLFGADAIERVAASPEIDTVVAAIVGAAGLRGTWAAIESGKRVCIANKETLVVAGPLVMDLARRRGAAILPVDSEHSAIFQALQAGRREDVKRIVLTASGGPFRGWSPDRLRGVTPAMACQHPTWNMGRKITVDSATLMNKSLEVIEAKWLFGLDDSQIEVVVHPQSVVHSLVEFVDGSVIAQMSPPDMKLPIQYALTFPERISGPSPRLDWSSRFQLDFEPPDPDNFPALRLGYEVARRGGTCGAVLNAANEVAVERFLSSTDGFGFCDIPAACRAVLEQHHFEPSPSLDALVRLDQWAREETWKWR
jgi:1-deoxy-D-xylulose-5-phosphate reductoisomerase